MAARQSHRPRVYFEEWDEPMITGIQWVSELIELAGGQDVFRNRSTKLAKERFVTAGEVIERHQMWFSHPGAERHSTGKRFVPGRV